MIWIALALFAIAAFFGLTLLIRRMADNALPGGVILIHGVLAGAALVLALVVGAGAGPTRQLATIGLATLVVAALVGLGLLVTYLRKGSFPAPMAVVHALVALGGFLLLFLWRVTA